MTPPRTTYVYITLGSDTIPAGRLDMVRENGVAFARFRYGRRYLLRRDAVALDPVQGHLRYIQQGKHRNPLQTQRGNLVTQRLLSPRGHHNKSVLATCDMLNNSLLLPPKPEIDEGFLQDGEGGGHGKRRWGN